MVAVAVSAQSPRVFTAKCNIAQTGSGSGYWQVGVTGLNDPGGLDATEIQVNDKLLFNDGGIQYTLNITTIVSAVGNSATIRVSNLDVTGISSVPTTSAVISRGTSNFGFAPDAANISQNDKQFNSEYTLYRIDSIIANNGGVDTSYTRNDSVFVVSGGVEYFSGSFVDNAKILNWVARQKLEPQLNPPVSLTVGDTVFSRVLDAKYLYVPNSQEQRIYFVSTVNGSTVRGYRFVSSYDYGRTWSWANTQPAYFTPIGWGHEVNLHEHFILAEDSLNWKMWYQAVDSLNIYRTRFATSTDAGKSWTRQGTCLDVGGIGEWDNTYAGVRNVLKLDDGTYYMCYEGRDSTHNMSAGIATSTDGLNWTKKGQVLVMDTAIYSWESNGMIPYVQKINGKYLMLYGNNNQNTLLNDDQYIGMAYSDDGINFTKYENNPILNLDTFFDPESGWNYFEEFISFEPVPGQEGAFSVITRGRKEFGAIWNFGLYWLGNRIQVPQSTGNQWYVNTIGKNYSALNGGIFDAASSPYYIATTTGKARTGSVINVLSGTYTAGLTPTFSSNYIQHSLARRDSIVLNCDRGVTFYANLPTSTFCFASDANASVSSDSSRFFTVRGKPSFKINRTSTSGTNLGIGFYNIASNIDLSLRRIENLGGGRNWGLQVGCGTAKIDCDEIEVSGGVVASIGNASSAGSVISTYNKRNINIKVGASISNGVSDSFGAYRYQCSQTKDSMSLITFEIGRAILQGTRHSLVTIRTTGFKSSLLDYNFGNVIQKTAASKINGYSTSGTAEILFDSKPTFSGGNVNINIKNIETPNSILLSSDTANYTMDSTIIHLKIDKGKFTSSSPFVVSGITLRNHSKLIIECEHCSCTGAQSALWIFGNTIDASSSIEIRGSYVVNGSRPVLNTRNNVTLENVTLINDGTVASVQSDTATSIVVKSCYTNAVATDSDITELVNSITKNSSVK